MPDIVAYQVALFRLGIAGWVVGSRAPYHPAIEQAYMEIYGLPAPPKAFQTTRPRFWGIGEPPTGHAKARLFRVLLESEPSRVREALDAPWDETPEIRSEFA